MKGRRNWSSRATLIAREIGTEIVSGKFAPGEILAREADLSAKYAVSRNTLREAMKALAAKSLVGISPRRGTVVLPRDRWNMLDREVIDWIGPVLWTDRAFLEEVLVVRAALEPAAATEAALRASPYQLRRIRDAYDKMRALAQSAEKSEKVDVDLAWHIAVTKAANNRFLSSIMAGVVHALRSQFVMLTLRDGNYEGNLENHGAVTCAIEEGNGEEAARLMRQLIEQARRDTEEMLP